MFFFLIINGIFLLLWCCWRAPCSNKLLFWNRQTDWRILAISRPDVADCVAVSSVKWVCFEEKQWRDGEVESSAKVSPLMGRSGLIGNGAVWTQFEPAKNRNMTNCFISFVCSELFHLFVFYFKGFSEARPARDTFFCCLGDATVVWMPAFTCLWSCKPLMLWWGGATVGLTCSVHRGKRTSEGQTRMGLNVTCDQRTIRIHTS